MPVRVIQLDIPISEAYSLESVGKHGFGKCVYESVFKLKQSNKENFKNFIKALDFFLVHTSLCSH